MEAKPGRNKQKDFQLKRMIWATNNFQQFEVFLCHSQSIKSMSRYQQHFKPYKIRVSLRWDGLDQDMTII